jgi:CopG family nickel-responsive transcriptional regulator
MIGGDSMTNDSGATRLSVSLPFALVKEFDVVWQGMKYTNRSKAVHDAIRTFITEHKWTQEEEGKVTGAIVLLYYFDKPALMNTIMRIQHEFEDIITSSMHIHLTKDKCLETIAVKGSVQRVRILMQKLMAKKGVKQVKLAAITP